MNNPPPEMPPADRTLPRNSPITVPTTTRVPKSRLEYWGANNMLFRGRLDRTSFAMAMLLTYILLAITGYGVLFSIALLLIIADDRAYFIVFPFIAFCLGLFSIAVVLHFSAVTRRLHDINKPGSSAWLYYGAVLASIPGTKGPNRYGTHGRHLRFLELLSLGINEPPTHYVPNQKNHYKKYSNGTIE